MHTYECLDLHAYICIYLHAMVEPGNAHITDSAAEAGQNYSLWLHKLVNHSVCFTTKLCMLA